MDSRWHLELGLRALERGLLDARRLAEALAELGDGTPRQPEELWVREGRLTREQLATLSIPIPRKVDSNTVLERKPPRARVPTPSAIVTADTSLLERDNRPFDPRRGRDPYKRVATLGTGGMGQVHQCIDEDLGRLVALKALKPELAGDSGSARMLWREAQVTGSLEHPNILPIYDVGTHPDIGPYYVMRLIQQPTLGDVLTLLRQEDPDATRNYSLWRLLRMFIQICETIDYAHSRGVIHCDLKPQNILLGPFGEVLVVDWGMAYRVAEGMVYRGGTPGYMAPEQMDRSNRTLDARSDVYALGAVLYEILCLQPAWKSRDTMPDGAPPESIEMLPPSLPSHVAPWRQIPGELDEIAMKALSTDREARFTSAREMALALENFLEGTKEKEQRRLRAQAATEEGDRLAESFLEFVDSRPERLAELRELATQVAPWEPAERKAALWDAEDRLAVTDALGIRTLQAAVAAYDSALAEVQAHAPARRGLARLYHAQMLQAKERGEELDRLYFEELLAQYDDGTRQQKLQADGALAIDCPGAAVTLAAVEEDRRRLLPGAAKSVPNQTRVALAPGRWLITVENGGARARVPLMMAPGGQAKVAIDFAAIGAPGPNEALVAGEGRPSGTGSPAAQGSPAPFFVDVFPVDFKEYLRFLAALDREAAEAHLPRTRDQQPLWTLDGAPARITQFGEDEARLLALPAFGVSTISAEAYAAWRAQQTGRPWRLPTESEWERAATGGDGRRYPWGDRFDASFCKMRQSRAGAQMPEPPGAFALDEAPSGARDLAGGIADWVIPSRAGTDLIEGSRARVVVSRGGAWCDWEADCLLTARRSYLATERSTRVGFRLVRSALVAPRDT